MKENIKIGLLAIITVTLIANTFLMNSSSKTSTTAPQITREKKNTNLTVPSTIPLNNVPAKIAAPTGPVTAMNFAEPNFNFGTLKQDTKNTHLFKFTNTGSNPLIITNAKGSCGCTVPKYPTQPIAPGATGEIEVVYSPGKQKGNQTKSVTITANTNPVQTRIQFTANVEEI